MPDPAPARGPDAASSVPDLGGSEVSFVFEGHELRGREGEPLAVALWRAGHVVLGRSIKYHRPRGPYCFQGACPGCLVRVDGEPNVRACQTPVREGCAVETQVGTPSARRDLFGVIDHVFDKGFDHQRLFVRPKAVADAYHWTARRMAGAGRLPDAAAREDAGPLERTVAEPDVLVAGAGPAGLSAAIAAAEAGASVLVADPWPGGHLVGTEAALEGAGAGAAAARALEARARAAGATVAAGPVLGLYEDGVVPVLTPRGLVEARPKAVVVATGATETPLLVPNGDLPGVLGSRALGRLVLGHGWTPDGPVVVAGGADAGVLVAAALAARGARVAVAGPITASTSARQRLAGSHATLIGEAVARVEGQLRVEAVVLSDGRRIPASVVAVNAGLSPTTDLAQQAGVPRRWSGALGGFVPLAGPDGATARADLFVAGSAAGLHDTAAAAMQGRLAGRAAAGAVQGSGAASDERARKGLEAIVEGLPPDEGAALAALWRDGGARR